MPLSVTEMYRSLECNFHFYLQCISNFERGIRIFLRNFCIFVSNYTVTS